MTRLIFFFLVNSFVFTDIPYEPPRRPAWTGHGHPTPQSKGTDLALIGLHVTRW
jgi:hypothetical protein